MFKKECKFVIGASKKEDLGKLPPLPHIAFVGRSNVGKSSLINALLGSKKIARTSSTPGRTRQINFFNLVDKLLIADLPGYGFAKVSKQEVREWKKTIFDYLVYSSDLRRVLLLIDARRGLMDSDREMMEILDEAAVSYQITLTKTDKLKQKELEKTLSVLNEEIRNYTAVYPEVILSSANKNVGIRELRKEIEGLVK